MGTVVLTLILVTVLASLASWLFGQWPAGGARVSGAALAVGGGGTVLLIGAVALVMIAASTGWQRLIPIEDFSLLAPAPTSARGAGTARVEPRPEPEASATADPAAATERLRLGKGGPLVAPIFTIRDAAGARRQIRYLACEVLRLGID